MVTNYDQKCQKCLRMICHDFIEKLLFPKKNIPLSLIKQTLFNQLDPKISMINMLNYKSIFVINYLMTSDILFGHFDQLTLIRYVSTLLHKHIY